MPIKTLCQSIIWPQVYHTLYQRHIRFLGSCLYNSIKVPGIIYRKSDKINRNKKWCFYFYIEMQEFLVHIKMHIIQYWPTPRVVCFTQKSNNEILSQQKNVTLIVIYIPFLLRDKNWKTTYSLWHLNILKIIFIVTRSMLKARNAKEIYWFDVWIVLNLMKNKNRILDLKRT